MVKRCAILLIIMSIVIITSVVRTVECMKLSRRSKLASYKLYNFPNYLKTPNYCTLRANGRYSNHGICVEVFFNSA
jgi:hypothetical protein